jgi:hypothetical protein
MLSLSLGSLIDECDWIEEREVIMEIMKFQKFKDHLLKKGMLTLLFNIEEEYMEMHFHIYSVTEDLILKQSHISYRSKPLHPDLKEGTDILQHQYFHCIAKPHLSLFINLIDGEFNGSLCGRPLGKYTHIRSSV